MSCAAGIALGLSGIFAATTTHTAPTDIVSDGARKACITAGGPGPYADSAQDVLAAILLRAKRSHTGANNMRVMEQKGTQICFEPSLDKANECRVVKVGVFNDSKNRIKLNPDFPAERSIAVLIHEGRHMRQNERHIRWRQKGNIREEERVMLKWAMEADARVSSIVFAYEMQQKGNPVYIDNLRQSKWYGHMVKAFERQIAQNPRDIKTAMRAAFKAFRQNSRLARNYDNHVAAWIEGQPERAFDAALPQDTLLTDELLQALGTSLEYGNYMDESLMDFIRTSFTNEDYRALIRDRGKAVQAPTLKCG